MRLKRNLAIFYNETKLETTNSENLLGVIIDKNILWKCHIDNLAQTLNKANFLLRRIKKFLPLDCRLTFYKTFLQPHMDYCCTSWSQLNHTKRIRKLQNISQRIIYDKPKMTPSRLFFQLSRILPIEKRVIFRLRRIAFKAVNNMPLCIFLTCFTLNHEYVSS